MEIHELEEMAEKHRERKAALEKQRDELVRGLRNADAMKRGRALEVARSNEELSPGANLDAVLTAKMQPVTQMRDNLEKLSLAIDAEAVLIRDYEGQRKRLEAEGESERRRESAQKIFEAIDTAVASFNMSQRAFRAMVEQVREHPSLIEDWTAQAENAKRHVVYGIAMDSLLAPGNLPGLTLEAFFAQLHELVRPGLGNYGDVPAAIRPDFDGTVQSPFPINAPFTDRQSFGIGFNENASQPKDAARSRLAEILASYE